jgi:ATP-dependent DNA helicase RecG
LTLILYGDLDVSLIDELPSGRKKIETYYIQSSIKERFFNFVKKELNQGRQAYFVCPLVEESEKLDLSSATKYRDELQNKYFRGFKVGLLHGKMKADEKNQIMEEMRKGNINILVSTTVIEVGVNIPNATIMAVENAERFGLAQLHQLRGRVGRGEEKSYCILITEACSQEAVERMKIMTENSDGFIIAEKDMQLRGTGEFFGLRQHGLPELKIADLINDLEILKLTKDAAKNILNNKKLTLKEYEALNEEVQKKFNTNFDKMSLN